MQFDIVGRKALRKNEPPTGTGKTIAPQAGFQEKFVRSNVDCTFGGGVLNPQPITSHILTPTGFRVLADVKAGDEVLGLENEIQHITHCDREGEKDCIRVVLEDGSSAESALDHKWWVLKGGQEMTAISFELLESFQIAEEKGVDYEVYIFRYMDGKPVPKKISKIIDIGKKEVVCLGVSNDDELYITDDYLITKNCGKAQPYSSRIATPWGFTSMGYLKEGDVIFDVDGTWQRVERIYEKGMRDIYTVDTHAGPVKCTLDHLWYVWDSLYKRFVTITTGDMMDNPHRYYIPCCAPLEYANPETPPAELSPYKLGRILAFGQFNPTYMSDNVKYKLETLGILDDFFIPYEYLHASLADRREILHGLVDSLAEMVVKGETKAVRIKCKERLYTSLQPLISSLGGTVSIHWRRGKYYVVNILMPDLSKYATRGVGCDQLVDMVPWRRIDKIFKCGREPARCILVSGENHLYLTDNYTITHNTFAAILMVAEPSREPEFRAAFTRRNLGNLKQGGGIVDDFKSAYGTYVHATTSDNPRITFASGAFVDCLHIADETPAKLMERAKGWQYDCIYLDELTSYEFSTFSIVGTRCRGKAKWTGKIRGTTNPKRSHWTRKMLDWYIGMDGFVIPERDGVVRYYFQMGETVDDIVWGDTKEEVYHICKSKIDAQLSRLGGSSWTYRDIIRSFVFYAGKMSENRASIGSNASYIGSVSAVGGKRAQQLIEGNFNVDEEEDDKAPISSMDAQKVFTNDECRNGDLWITVDLADVGTDNVVGLFWDGLHVQDILIIKSSTPRMNFERITMFARKHNVSLSHIIYDATHAAYMLDYMPDAVPFVSASSPRGLYALSCDRLKDECYLRLIDVITGERMSFNPDVASMHYTHQKITTDLTVQNEFLDECSVVRLRETTAGKKKLWSKKEMNANLGMHRSMDLLDPCAMRMLPLLEFQYGDELSRSLPSSPEDVGDGEVNVYDESFWC